MAFGEQSEERHPGCELSGLLEKGRGNVTEMGVVLEEALQAAAFIRRAVLRQRFLLTGVVRPRHRSERQKFLKASTSSWRNFSGSS